MLIRWLNYLKERFPLPLYLLLSLGMAWQAQLAVHARPETTGLIFASVMILGFFFCLRLMDEVKDFHKDQIAHPERPLARGLIKLDEAKRLILISMIIMLLLNISPPLLYSALARQFWSFTCLWLWLMYREFYCRRWLEKRVFLYAITHQLILFPLLSSVAMLGLSDWNQNILAPSLSILGAFFSYEIARKLDPNALPILMNYRTVYGRFGSLALLFLTSAVLMCGTYLVAKGELSHYAVYWFFALLVPIAAYFFAESKAKWVEGLGGLSLLVHIWGPIAQDFIYHSRG